MDFLLHVIPLITYDIHYWFIQSRSLYVKNLNFKTSDESLKKHFGDNMKCGSIRSVKVKLRVSWLAFY